MKKVFKALYIVCVTQFLLACTHYASSHKDHINTFEILTMLSKDWFSDSVENTYLTHVDKSQLRHFYDLKEQYLSNKTYYDSLILIEKRYSLKSDFFNSSLYYNLRYGSSIDSVITQMEYDSHNKDNDDYIGMSAAEIFSETEPDYYEKKIKLLKEVKKNYDSHKKQYDELRENLENCKTKASSSISQLEWIRDSLNRIEELSRFIKRKQLGDSLLMNCAWMKPYASFLYDNGGTSEAYEEKYIKSDEYISTILVFFSDWNNDGIPEMALPGGCHAEGQPNYTQIGDSVLALANYIEQIYYLTKGAFWLNGSCWQGECFESIEGLDASGEHLFWSGEHHIDAEDEAHNRYYTYVKNKRREVSQKKYIASKQQCIDSLLKAYGPELENNDKGMAANLDLNLIAKVTGHEQTYNYDQQSAEDFFRKPETYNYYLGNNEILRFLISMNMLDKVKNFIVEDEFFNKFNSNYGY